METVESHDPGRKKFFRAMEHFSDWPFVEELQRPAGQTSSAIQEYIHRRLESSPGDRLSQQYVTPDFGTAWTIITYSQDMGAPREVLDSVYDTLLELELYKANPVGEYPRPLSAFPEVDVANMKQRYRDQIEGKTE